MTANAIVTMDFVMIQRYVSWTKARMRRHLPYSLRLGPLHSSTWYAFKRTVAKVKIHTREALLDLTKTFGGRLAVIKALKGVYIGDYIGEYDGGH